MTTKLRIPERLCGIAVPHGDPLDRATELAFSQARSAQSGRVYSVAVAAESSLWENGRVLDYSFIGGTPRQHKKVDDVIQEWTWYANVTFERSPSSSINPTLRIAFDSTKGSWSHVGTSATTCPAPAPTMNLGWIGDTDILTKKERGLILHEFGHVLGLRHEHESPARSGVLRLKPKEILQHYKDTQNWDADKVQSQVLDVYSAGEVSSYSQFDPTSIMIYFMPASMNEGGVAIPEPTELSMLDKAFVVANYPRPRPHPRAPQWTPEFALAAAGATTGAAAAYRAADHIRRKREIFGTEMAELREYEAKRLQLVPKRKAPHTPSDKVTSGAAVIEHSVRGTVDVDAVQNGILSLLLDIAPKVLLAPNSQVSSSAVTGIQHAPLDLNNVALDHPIVQHGLLTFFAKLASNDIIKKVMVGAMEPTESRVPEIFNTLKTSIIYEKPLPANSSTWHVDISQCGTPERYRLVDCSRFLAGHIRIEEYTELPAKYCALSYIWRGNPTKEGDIGGRLTVEGADHDSDPISVEVLQHACTATLNRGISHIWMDQLCIMQKDRQDKDWQIKMMYGVYKSCTLCVVVPGGIQRLVALNEETMWIHRGWTLQEALAPPEVVVLFTWGLGPGHGNASVGIKQREPVEEVVPQKSAMASLRLVLDACTVGYLSFESEAADTRRSPLMINASIFSEREFHTSNDPPFWQPQRKILAPNVTALAVAMNLEFTADHDTKMYAIWKSALMRASSRPVDMVYSIMGLFDITLDPKQFKKDDRIGATIALATEILKKGGRANWLAASFQLAPSRHISTFSTFPRTTVQGRALVLNKGRLRQVAPLVDSDYPNVGALVKMPTGRMDPEGYFHFNRKAIRLTQVPADRDVLPSTKRYDNASKPTLVRAVDSSVWAVGGDEQASQNPQAAYMVLLGWFSAYFPGATPADDGDNIRAMLVEKHSDDGRYHLRSFVFLSRQSTAWVTDWQVFPFAVGPNPGAPDEVEQVDETTMPREKLPIPPSMRRDGTLEDQVNWKARWAIDQEVAERWWARPPN